MGLVSTPQIRQSMDLLALSMAIADQAVRTDIEINCAAWHDAEGQRFYDTLAPADIDSDLDAAANALAYIDARGDVFPWHLKRHINAPHMVQFVDKEAGHGR